MSRALLEWKYLLLLAELGIPVPEAVALGFRGQEGYLLIREIPGARSLKEMAFEPGCGLPFPERRRLVADVAGLLSSLHNAGILHRDLHFGNVVCDSRRKVHILDLHDVRRPLFLGKRALLDNLAMFGSSFTVSRVTDTDRLHFLRKYREGCALFRRTSWADLVSRARTRLWRYQLRFWRRRDRRCFQTSRHFRPFRSPLGSGMAACDGERHLDAFALLRSGDASGRTVWKDSRSTLVVRTEQGVLKVYRRKKLYNWLFDCFRASRARRAWLAGHRCLVRSIPTARPLAFVEKRFGPILLSCALLTEEITDALPLGECLRLLGDGEARNALLEKVERLIRNLHERGLSHRDLKCNNILARGGDVYLIDLDGLSCPIRLTERRKARDRARWIRSRESI